MLEYTKAEGGEQLAMLDCAMTPSANTPLVSRKGCPVRDWDLPRLSTKPHPRVDRHQHEERLKKTLLLLLLLSGR
jgi:hypothetical protein